MRSRIGKYLRIFLSTAIHSQHALLYSLRKHACSITNKLYGGDLCTLVLLNVYEYKYYRDTFNMQHPETRVSKIQYCMSATFNIVVHYTMAICCPTFNY